MVDRDAPTYTPPPSSLEDVSAGAVMVRAEDVHVYYRVFEDVNMSLRAILASGGRRRRFKEVKAVRGISFTAHAGDAIGVIGANGSGKTTLMRAVAGLLPVNKGAVYARATPMLLGVGAVLNKTLSGRRNIVLGGLALGLTRDQVREREQEIIDFAGIGRAIDLPMKTYSSGMSARLQFAISAAVMPEILIIDEALSVGDRDFQERSNAKIQELRDAAGVVFLVSHSMQSIRQNCSRVLWLHDGKLVRDGDPEEVVDEYVHSDVRKHSDPHKREKRRQRLLKRKANIERQLQQLDEIEQREKESSSEGAGRAEPRLTPSDGN